MSQIKFARLSKRLKSIVKAPEDTENPLLSSRKARSSVSSDLSEAQSDGSDASTVASVREFQKKDLVKSRVDMAPIAITDAGAGIIFDDEGHAPSPPSLTRSDSDVVASGSYGPPLAAQKLDNERSGPSPIGLFVFTAHKAVKGSNGFWGIGPIFLASILIYECAQIANRSDLLQSQKGYHYKRIFAEVGVGVTCALTAGGVATAAMGATLAAGLPGIFLSVFCGWVAAVAGTLTFDRVMKMIEQDFQSEDRACLEILGFEEPWGDWSDVYECVLRTMGTEDNRPPVAIGSSVSVDAKKILRVLENPNRYSGRARRAAVRAIERQFRRRARVVHPDKEGGSEDEFKRLEEAKQRLSNKLLGIPDRWTHYDPAIKEADSEASTAESTSEEVRGVDVPSPSKSRPNERDCKTHVMQDVPATVVELGAAVSVPA